MRVERCMCVCVCVCVWGGVYDGEGGMAKNILKTESK